MKLRNSLMFMVVFILAGIYFVSAESNGIWHFAEDVRGGIFGGDEQEANMNYTFINPVYFEENAHSEVLPTEDDHLVNKAYVDALVLEAAGGGDRIRSQVRWVNSYKHFFVTKNSYGLNSFSSLSEVHDACNSDPQALPDKNYYATSSSFSGGEGEAYYNEELGEQIDYDIIGFNADSGVYIGCGDTQMMVTPSIFCSDLNYYPNRYMNLDSPVKLGMYSSNMGIAMLGSGGLRAESYYGGDPYIRVRYLFTENSIGVVDDSGYYTKITNAPVLCVED